MKCPQCSKPTDVINTRVSADGLAVYRRRQCFNNHRFTTTELVGTIDDIRAAMFKEVSDRFVATAERKMRIRNASAMPNALRGKSQRDSEVSGSVPET